MSEQTKNPTVEELDAMPLNELRAAFLEHVGEETRAINKKFLIRKILETFDEEAAKDFAAAGKMNTTGAKRTAVVLSKEDALAKLTEMAKGAQIFDSEEQFSFTLVAWPYSRNLVLALCKYFDTKCVVTRLSKKDEQFSVVGGSEEFAQQVAAMISLIHSCAKAHYDGSYSEARNTVVAELIDALDLDVNEFPVRSKSGPKKAEAATETEDEADVDAEPAV